jgi:hypothetical protein
MYSQQGCLMYFGRGVSMHLVPTWDILQLHWLCITLLCITQLCVYHSMDYRLDMLDTIIRPVHALAAGASSTSDCMPCPAGTFSMAKGATFEQT